jgi:hypothetical protein
VTKAALPANAASRADEVDERLCADERLSLDDALRPQAPARSDWAVAPWTLGLRG